MHGLAKQVTASGLVKNNKARYPVSRGTYLTDPASDNPQREFLTFSKRLIVHRVALFGTMTVFAYADTCVHHSLTTAFIPPIFRYASPQLSACIRMVI